MTVTAPSCPKCGGEMWDETKSKYFKVGKSPIAKCKDKDCDGKLWAEKKPATDNGSSKVEPLPELTFEQLTARYVECMAFIVKTIVPSLTKHDLGCDAQAVHAMATTLFIERNKRNV